MSLENVSTAMKEMLGTAISEGEVQEILYKVGTSYSSILMMSAKGTKFLKPYTEQESKQELYLYYLTGSASPN